MATEFYKGKPKENVVEFLKKYFTPFPGTVLKYNVTSDDKTIMFACNAEAGTQYLEVDFGDDKGFQQVPVSGNNLYNYTYSTHGLKVVKIKDCLTHLGCSAEPLHKCSKNLLMVTQLGSKIKTIETNVFAGCGVTLFTSHKVDNIEAIKDSAFYECQDLYNFAIGCNVKTIGRYSFFNCQNLETIGSLTNITSIGDNAFDSCSKLKSVTLGNSLVSIGEKAFNHCQALGPLTIPESVTSIKGNAFFGTTCQINFENKTCDDIMYMENYPFGSLNKFICSDGILQHDGTYTYITKNDMTYRVLLNSELTTEGDNIVVRWNNYGKDLTGNVAVPRYTNGQEVILQGPGATGVDDWDGGDGKHRLPNVSNVLLPEGLTRIGDHMFYESGLQTINFPSTLKEVSKNAFLFCTSLQRIDLPEGFTTIAMGAFSNCAALKYLYIPSTIESIGTKAFENVPATCQIVFNKPSAEVRSMANSLWAITSGAKIQCSDGVTITV